jgi:hypothetical protein
MVIRYRLKRFALMASERPTQEQWFVISLCATTPECISCSEPGYPAPQRQQGIAILMNERALRPRESWSLAGQEFEISHKKYDGRYSNIYPNFGARVIKSTVRII